LDQTIKIWDLIDGKLKDTIEVNKHKIKLYYKMILLLNDQNYIATYCENVIEELNIRIWDIRNKSLKYELNGHIDKITSVISLSDGNITSGSLDSSIKIWNPYTGNLILTLN
jgi:WD40 repeat protein